MKRLIGHLPQEERRLVLLLHEVWAELDTHRGQCAQLDAMANRVALALDGYAAAPPPGSAS